MEIQKGGALLETEEGFFEWLSKDSNIENLLKSTLRFLEYKQEYAKKLVKNSMIQLDEYWQTKVISRIKTSDALTKSMESTYDKLYKKVGKPGELSSKSVGDFYKMSSSILGSSEAEGKQQESNFLSKLAAEINQTQVLDTLYEARKKYICDTYFGKKNDPVAYKKALDEKRTSIRNIVNSFIETFTGDSNRRHRLFILNYAIDFAENWTTFQGNYKLNLLITGGAGLGKTTFAKSISQIFYEFGLLAQNSFQIREKTDFIGQYIGQTPTKTYATLYGALESMLFIDEAYSVSGCGTGASFDYGQEFIDALVDVSQKTRGLISIIAAGYKSEMHNCFLDKNPGMRRRFPNELELVPYTVIDLDNILSTNVIRPLFETQLDKIIKLDLLKEPGLYFTNPKKFKEFGREMTLRLQEIDPKKQLDATFYTNLLSDENRSSALVSIGKSVIRDYDTIIRYRLKVIGLYRFFLQLSSFDTNYSSFESMYAAHQYLWGLVTGNNPNRTYKYNNYRLLHLIYMSAHQQRREILKSYLLRYSFGEKEGSLFPNQAGDMDTLGAYIKSQPNLRSNTMPSLEEVTKLFNEYFRTRGGSKFLLRAEKEGEKIDLYVYHIGGGFLGYTDFEESVITKMFERLTFDGKTISALWRLGSLPEEQRDTIIRNINRFYSTACATLLQDAIHSMETKDAKEKNEKRLPSGIDIRFLEAEVNMFKSMNTGSELGDPDKMKYLQYVSDIEPTDDDSMISLLKQITEEPGAPPTQVLEPLNEEELCRNYTAVAPVKKDAAAPPVVPTLSSTKVKPAAAKSSKLAPELIMIKPTKQGQFKNPNTDFNGVVSGNFEIICRLPTRNDIGNPAQGYYYYWVKDSATGISKVFQLTGSEKCKPLPERIPYMFIRVGDTANIFETYYKEFHESGSIPPKHTIESFTKQSPVYVIDEDKAREMLNKIFRPREAQVKELLEVMKTQKKELISKYIESYIEESKEYLADKEEIDLSEPPPVLWLHPIKDSKDNLKLVEVILQNKWKEIAGLNLTLDKRFPYLIHGQILDYLGETIKEEDGKEFPGKAVSVKLPDGTIANYSLETPKKQTKPNEMPPTPWKLELIEEAEDEVENEVGAVSVAPKEIPKKLYYFDENPKGKDWKVMVGKTLYLDEATPIATITEATNLSTGTTEEGVPKIGRVFNVKMLDTNEKQSYMLVLSNYGLIPDTMPEPPWVFLNVTGLF